ncbi:SMI1/KNR4 family protein [Bacillus pseudomycoides]|uniref:SMI1/KNR4 family protein n=2 Tax=Bacillus pseudomycoides TaxID=64104 RepID=UPI000BEE576D|nr:SMI1/KNR4 family protein [Bacillus pseudomycoides]PED05080.1 1,3-beta-glucan synthase regulator [Bacillus pseudomycoides]PEI84366.1 1,3-beta-glucan synthase regulator [Bacillus pseudomycoides]PEK11753.1 1,3-beta-glucan synthase regulator [Bacillus pseudomycoides]PEM61896.1 1,3-beta-glucan synthase regulator [Bacillus pseudomycoides]PEO10886.1 1,3-beta-glucan synthase regulator [Bacillus pseudomycoides]
MIDLFKVSGLIKNNPVSDIEMQKLEELMKIELPNVYKDLLRYTNGFSIGGGLTIYGTEDIVERNETWEVTEYASGYVSIGDDGSGNVFFMLQGVDVKEVLVVDSGDMDPNHATVIALDFSDWVNAGCLNEKIQKIAMEFPDTCNIVLVETPNGGLKDLVKIKSVLAIDISTGDLLKGSKNLPFTLVKKFPYGKAGKLIEKLGHVGVVLNVVPTDINN